MPRSSRIEHQEPCHSVTYLSTAHSAAATSKPCPTIVDNTLLNAVVFFLAANCWMLPHQLGGKPDLIIGNYSDGNLVSSLLSHYLNTTQCTIAHALEKTKYPVRAGSLHVTRLFFWPELGSGWGQGQGVEKGNGRCTLLQAGRCRQLQGVSRSLWKPRPC